MKKIALILVVFLHLAVGAQVNHADLDAILMEFVSPEGEVNYGELQKNGGQLEAYLKTLQSNQPDASWDAKATKAYWMNAYNAYTLQLMIENYPLKSITDLEKPWDREWIPVGDEMKSLNWIEHEVLRKDFSDPRIHVGINCASKSCPRLAQTAFNEENVEGMLTELMTEFVNDGTRNQITEKKIGISSIFQWFEEDFTTEGDIIDFLNEYSATKISPKAKISYIEYDWNLNGF